MSSRKGRAITSKPAERVGAVSRQRHEKGAALERQARRAEKPGLAARRIAVAALEAIIARRLHLDDAIAASIEVAGAPPLEPRDRAFVRLLVATVLRRMGELDAVIGAYLSKPLPRRSGPLRLILATAAAQLLLLDTPPHAAIGLAVDQAKLDPDARHFDKLANAVLRRVAEDGKARLSGLEDPVALDVPAPLLARWSHVYGPDTARRIAAASLEEPLLDLSVKADAAGWAERLGGVVLPTGSVRLRSHGRVEDLPGYAEGAWWVQDAAAALPVRLLGNLAGQDVADLCAAPGGKTAELSAAGARVTSVDVSAPRLARVAENLERLGLAATLVEQDLMSWEPGREFDAVLLDAPCSATGTLRRHPEILFTHRTGDLPRFVAVQSALIDRAARWVRPGGLLVYSTCSLEPEEGEHQISAFLGRNAEFQRVPVEPREIGGLNEAVTPAGDMRTQPHHEFGKEGAYRGLDGFFAARLRRVAMMPPGT